MPGFDSLWTYGIKGRRPRSQDPSPITLINWNTPQLIWQVTLTPGWGTQAGFAVTGRSQLMLESAGCQVFSFFSSSWPWIHQCPSHWNIQIAGSQQGDVCRGSSWEGQIWAEEREEELEMLLVGYLFHSPGKWHLRISKRMASFSWDLIWNSVSCKIRYCCDRFSQRWQNIAPSLKGSLCSVQMLLQGWRGEGGKVLSWRLMMN